MSLIELKIDSIQYSETQSGAYVLFLIEPESQKKLPIVIGGLEAHSIAVGMEKDLKPERPLTHDLMKSVMDAYGIRLKRVIINKLDQGIFYALLVTEKNGNEMLFDSRTSDAVAMAARYDVPIYCEKSIMDEAGIILPQKQEEQVSPVEPDEDDSDFENMIGLIKDFEDVVGSIEDDQPEAGENKEELQPTELEKLSKEIFGQYVIPYSYSNKKEIEKLLQAAIEEEQYERAAKLKRMLELMQEE